MSVDRSTLLRYLRQLSEFGERELFFEKVTGAEALMAVTPPGAAGAATAAAAAGALRPVRTTSVAQAAPTATAAAAAPISPALQVLQTQAHACVNCRLHEGRTTVVFGEGNPNAEVMVVGEAPGQEEDKTGRPFVGQAGKLLDLLLMTAGFPRENVYICNTLKCRPPNNRNPLPDELAACSNFLQGQIDVIKPRALIAVGKFAAQALLQSEESIGRMRGQVHRYRDIPMIVTYHPAYLLRTPSASRVAWQDFQLLRQVLDEQA